MTWKDTTTRSRNEPDKPASCWTLDTGKVRIDVATRYADGHREWVVTCYEVNFIAKRIGCKHTAPGITARAAALDLVKKELREMLESLGG